MENTVLAATAQQIAIRRQMDVIANNVANSNTLGFKGERMVFAQYLTDIGNGEKMAMVEIAAVVRDFTDGPLQATGNPLDVAIRGEGFFQVETPDGIRYTRSGNFRLDASGALVTSDGHAPPIQGPVFEPRNDGTVFNDPAHDQHGRRFETRLLAEQMNIFQDAAYRPLFGVGTPLDDGGRRIRGPAQANQFRCDRP